MPKGVPAGVYRGTVRVSTDRGKAEPGHADRLDFDLPDGPTHSNHFGGLWGIASVGVKYNSDEFREIEARYCEALAEHRLNPPSAQAADAAGESGRFADHRHEQARGAARRPSVLHVTDFEIPFRLSTPAAFHHKR